MNKKIYICIAFFLFAMNTRAQLICDQFCNGGADSIFYGNPPSFRDSSQLPCWRTTSPDGLMEIWQSGFNGVPSYSGIQHLELNAHYFSTMYQNITVVPGTVLNISFAHRGRGGIDTMSVSVGPVGGPYSTLGYFADGITAWGYYTVNYFVPSNLGNYYSIRFNAVYSAFSSSPQTVGNFLDAVTVCQHAEKPTGTEEITNENYFSVYPNPVSEGSITISCPQPGNNLHYKISDSVGKIVATGTNDDTGNQFTIDMSNLLRGVYFITLYDRERSLTQKIIKL